MDIEMGRGKIWNLAGKGAVPKTPYRMHLDGGIALLLAKAFSITYYGLSSESIQLRADDLFSRLTLWLLFSWINTRNTLVKELATSNLGLTILIINLRKLCSKTSPRVGLQISWCESFPRGLVGSLLMTHQGFMKLSWVSSSFNFRQQLCCSLLHTLRTNTGKERWKNQYLGIQASRPYGNVWRVDSAHVLESFWERHCFSPIVKRKLLVVTHFRTSKHGLSELAPSLSPIGKLQLFLTA